MKNLLIILFIFISGSIYAQSPDSTTYKINIANNDSLSINEDDFFSIEEKENDAERIVTIKIDRVLFKKVFREKKAIIKRAFKIHREALRKTREEMKNEEIIDVEIKNEETKEIKIEMKDD